MIQKNIYSFVLLAVFGISVFFFRSIQMNGKLIAYSDINEKETEETLEKKTQDAKDRDEYFFMLLRDPSTNAIPKNIREREIEFAASLPRAENRLMKGMGSSGINWNEVGPYDVGGRTRALAVDVADNSSKTLLAGSVSGGIWKTTDKGLTWKIKSSLDHVLSITSIAQDTRVGYRNIWYAVSGEYSGNSASAHGGAAFLYGGGLYKSIDNGESWNKVTSNNIKDPAVVSWNSEFSIASKVVVSPTTGTVFIASNAGVVLKSTNFGNDWIVSNGSLNDHYHVDVAVTQNGSIVSSLSQRGYNSSKKITPGIYISKDDGGTWSNITPIDFPTEFDRTVIATVQSNPNSIYTLTDTGKKVESSSVNDVRLYKINISDNSFTNLTSNLPDFSSDSGAYINTQGGYNLALAVHPSNENIIMIGATSLFRSLDGFTTKPASQKLNWIGGYSYDKSAFFYPGLHPDIHTIVFDPSNSNEVWVGHDGGMSFCKDISSVTYGTFFPWEDKDKDYAVTQFYTMAISQTANDTRLFGGTQDNGSPFFRWNGSSSTNSVDITSGDGSYCYIGTNFLYGSTQNGSILRFGLINKSDVNQNVWSRITPDTAKNQKFINPFVVDPNNENYMYYLGGKFLWRNNQLTTLPNFNQSKLSQGWSVIDLGLSAGYTFSTLAISRANYANVLYLAASSSSDQPKIFKMEDALNSSSASDVTPVFPAPAPNGVPKGSYVHSIAINPDNSNEVLIALSNYNVQSLWYTNDGGSTWTDVEGNLTLPSIRSASILPVSNGKLFILGTSIGVYSTYQLNGSNTTWNREGAGSIGNVVVQFITSRKSDGTVVIGTHGRGVFVGKYSVSGVENLNEIPASFTLEQNYPNPFNPNTKIKFSIPKSTDVTIKIYDITGREVRTILKQNMQTGSYLIDFEATGLASGVYIYRIETKEFVQSKKMLLMR